MIVTRKHLPRRTFLRGLGTAIALPMLDAMSPALANTARLKGKPPTRMAFVYVPNGIDMTRWTPNSDGSSFKFSEIIEPLEPYREKMLVLTGLTQNNGRALGDGPGDHARASATFLTGVHPRKTAGADIEVGISADQVAAQAIGGATRFASIELGCEDGRLVGSCDSGYSCAYSNSISWRTANTPNPPEINPRLVFERFFGDVEAGLDPAAMARRDAYKKSILDFVRDDAGRLRGELGPSDQRKLDEYLTGVREIEQRIEKSRTAIAPPIEKPAGIPIEYHEHARLMFDLMKVAFRTDMTRVATFMMGREGSNRAYREIGVSDPHHGLSHHRNNRDWLDKIAKINRYHVEQFVYFIEGLNSAQDGDGTLLDNTMVVYGSGLSDGNRHTHHDLPCMLVGGTSASIKTGRHIMYPKDTPMNNLFVSMLDRVGVPVETLGDSTGKLTELSDLA
jgi:hypothetical protein